MADGQWTLEELADRTGVSGRAVRFYVQRGLLPPPLGLGRGRHYDQRHEDVLRRIQELQAAGHSLDAIGKILSAGATGTDAVAAGAPPAGHPTEDQRPRSRQRAMLSAELWTRLRLATGVELHFDAARHNPTVEQLLALREAVQRIFDDSNDDENDNSGGDETNEQQKAQPPARKEKS
jgi:DNA-binding transcriptional MerR regulator